MLVTPRPPVPTSTIEFRTVVGSNALIQRELLSASSFISAARERGIHVDQQQLEAWDHDGVFQPLAFATGPWMTWRSTEPYPTDGMVFRDERDFTPWTELAYDVDGYSRTSALYSEWQLLYGLEASDSETVTITLDALLGDATGLQSIAQRAREFRLPTRAALDAAWAPLTKMLVQLQARYWPLVHGRTVLLIDPANNEYVDALDLERKRATADEVAAELGLDAETATGLYEWLARRGRQLDPLPKLYDLRRLQPRRMIEKESGSGRLATDYYDAAQMVRRLVRDLTGELLPDIDEVDLGDRTPRSLARDHDQLMASLRRHRLYPHRLHLIVEGETEVAVVTRLFEAFAGTNLENAGIAMTNLGGDKLGDSKPMLAAFGAYANSVALLLDNENDVERITRQLREDGAVGDLHVELADPSLEEANFTIDELVDVVKQMAKAEGVELDLDGEAVTAALSSQNQGQKHRKGLASIIQSLAKHPDRGAYSFTKPDLGRHLADYLIAEVAIDPDRHDGVAARRPIVKWVLAYPVRAHHAAR